jgi:hypothetical protein
MQSRPPRSLRAALDEACWEKVLPVLLAYAERRLRRLGWSEGRDHRPSALEVGELVTEAVKRAYGGERNWNEDEPPELVAFLRGVIKSISSDIKKEWVRHPLDYLPEIPESSLLTHSENETQTADDQRIRNIEDAIGDDPDLESFYLAVLDGQTKREDIAAYLQWTPEKVSVVRKKFNRRLNSAAPKDSKS